MVTVQIATNVFQSILHGFKERAFALEVISICEKGIGYGIIGDLRVAKITKVDSVKSPQSGPSYTRRIDVSEVLSFLFVSEMGRSIQSSRLC